MGCHGRRSQPWAMARTAARRLHTIAQRRSEDIVAQPLFGAEAVRAANLLDLIAVVESGTGSKTLLNQAAFKQVLFAMDAGQELSQHRAPYLALVQVLDGRLRMHVSAETHTLGPMSWLLMPPDAPHDVHAELPTRFL